VGSGTSGPDSLIGRKIAGYELKELVGKGLTGAVFRAERVAEDGAGDAVVAVKVLFLPWQLDERERGELRQRFDRETETLQRLNHPHIIKVLKSGEEDGLTFIMMPYLPKTRAGPIARGQFPLDKAARIITQLASALDVAHEQGVIHRDIKPQNVLLDDDDNAYLADFSVARLLNEASSGLTTTRMRVGTVPYMSPEQVNSAKVGDAADIYSLGALLFEVVTGKVPFEAETESELARKIEYEAPPLPTSLRDLPEPAEAAIWQALDKNPDLRFPTATAFAQGFAAGLENQWEGVRPIVFEAPSNSQPANLSQTNITTLPPSGPWTPQVVVAPRKPWWADKAVPLALGAVALLTLVALVFTKGGPGAIFSPSATVTQGISNIGSSGGKTPTATHGKGRSPTATRSGHNNGGARPTSTSYSPPPPPGATPRPTATRTPRPTATPTATPRPPTPTPRPPTPTPIVKSIQIGWSSHSTWVWMTVRNFPYGTHQYTCSFSSGGDVTYNVYISGSPQTFDYPNTCYDGYHGDQIWIVIDGVASNHLTVP
jgi:serine/threonine-protein kinase